MKRLLFILIITLLLCCLVACDSDDNDNSEYEVISVASYTIITGADANGPIEKTRLVFIYMDNGQPRMISDYYEDTFYANYKDYIVIGNTNKYVVVREYRKVSKYLYLTQETYDKLFPEGHPNE